MKIQLPYKTPIFEKPSRFPLVAQEINSKQIQQWLKNEITQGTKLLVAAPVVMNKKKDGSHLLCICYREINKKIFKDRYIYL